MYSITPRSCSQKTCFVCFFYLFFFVLFHPFSSRLKKDRLVVLPFWSPPQFLGLCNVLPFGTSPGSDGLLLNFFLTPTPFTTLPLNVMGLLQSLYFYSTFPCLSPLNFSSFSSHLVFAKKAFSPLISSVPFSLFSLPRFYNPFFFTFSLFQRHSSPVAAV